jgi:hypothetical protein
MSAAMVAVSIAAGDISAVFDRFNPSHDACIKAVEPWLSRAFTSAPVSTLLARLPHRRSQTAG